MIEFNHYIIGSYLEDLQLVGLKFSWSNLGDSGTRIEYKLDRALINGTFFKANYYKGVIEVPAGLLGHSLLLFKHLENS